MLCFTSLLFLLPALVAFVYQIYDVAFACIACVITSLLYHSRPHDSQLQKMDMIVVNSIAAMYTTHAVLLCCYQPRYVLTVLISFFTLYIYLKKRLSHQYVHVLSVTGILCYIWARVA